MRRFVEGVDRGQTPTGHGRIEIPQRSSLLQRCVCYRRPSYSYGLY